MKARLPVSRPAQIPEGAFKAIARALPVLQALRVSVADPIARQQWRLDCPLLAQRWFGSAVKPAVVPDMDM